MLPRPIAALLTVSLLSCFALQATHAQEWIADQKHHAWGRFQPGSWKRVRVRKDKIDAEGKVVSTTTTDSITTLVETNSSSYTLMVDSEVEVGTQVFRGRPKYLKRYFRDELNGKIINDEALPTEELKIGVSNVQSSVRRIIFTADDWRRETRIHFSTNSPFILRRHTKSHAPSGALGYETKVQATRLGLLRRVRGEPRRVHEVQVVHRQAAHTTTTHETHCPDVPGAVIAHRLAQTDEKGRVVSRSRLELIDYHVSTGKNQIRRGRRGLLPRHTRGVTGSRP